MANTEVENYQQLLAPAFLGPLIRGCSLIDRINPGVLLSVEPPDTKQQIPGYLTLDMPVNYANNTSIWHTYAELSKQEREELDKDRFASNLRAYKIFNENGKIIVKKRFGYRYAVTGARHLSHRFFSGYRTLSERSGQDANEFLTNLDSLLKDFATLPEYYKPLTRDVGTGRQLYFLDKYYSSVDPNNGYTLLYPTTSTIQIDHKIREEVLAEEVTNNSQVLLKETQQTLFKNPAKRQAYDLLMSKPVLDGLLETTHEIRDHYPVSLTMTHPNNVKEEEPSLELAWFMQGSKHSFDHYSGSENIIGDNFMDRIIVTVPKGTSGSEGVEIKLLGADSEPTFSHMHTYFIHKPKERHPFNIKISQADIDQFSQAIKPVLRAINFNGTPASEYLQTFWNYFSSRRILLF